MGSPVRVLNNRPFDGVSVLVVDDDVGTCESTGAVLRHLGARVLEAFTGTAAIAIARAERLDLAVLDNRLPDMQGLDVAKAFRAQHIPLPWILVSGWMDYDVSLEAGRLGALKALDTPCEIEKEVTDVLRQIAAQWARGWPTFPMRPRLREPRSIVEECACAMWRACDSQDDVRTIADWAHAVGKGYSTLRKLCKRAGVEPEAAKDLTRILRVLGETSGAVASLKTHLRYGEDQTLASLLERAGLGAPSTPEVLTFEAYLVVQRLIAGDHPLMSALRDVLTTDS